jgi:hypothetical protein
MNDGHIPTEHEVIDVLIARREGTDDPDEKAALTEALRAIERHALREHRLTGLIERTIRHIAGRFAA